MRISDWSSDVCSSDLGDVNRAEAEIARRLPHIDGIMMFFVPLRREGRDAVGGEFARHILDGELVVGKLELVGHGHFSMMASASISTFHSGRSEERRVGKECVSTCRSRWLQYN